MGRKKKKQKINQNKLLLYILLTSIFLLFFTFYSEKYDLHLVNYSNKTNAELSQTSSSKVSPIETNGDELIIYFFDVGQADSILVSTQGKNMLIDAGNNSDGKLISEYLSETLKISTIDYLIGTHNHEDHIGGLDDIIENFEIKNLYMPYVSITSTQTYENVEEAAINKNLNIVNPNIGDTFNLGTSKIEVVNIDNSEPTNKNESSIVLEMQFGALKYLFTGDTEEENENSRTWNDIDVLKVAHHGSNTSNSERFLNQSKPEIAIISVGPNNSYNLPKENILNRIENIGAKIYRTDEVGTIVIKSDGNTNNVLTLDVCLDGNSR